MRLTQTLYYILAALLVETIVTATPLPSDRGLPNWDLTERQLDDVAGSARGNAAGIDGQPTQTQNTTSTAGSTGGAENGTTANAPGFITLPGYVYDDQVDCRNLRTGRANKCWDELQLTQWVMDWTNENKCYQTEPFSTCFFGSTAFGVLIAPKSHPTLAFLLRIQTLVPSQRSSTLLTTYTVSIGSEPSIKVTDSP